MNAIIQTPTPNLEKSLHFYSRLGFEVLSSANAPLVSDGKVLIEINPDRYARAGMKLIAADWTNTVEVLKQQTTVLPIEGGYVLGDTSGAWIYLMEESHPSQFELASLGASILGNYGGLSLEVIAIEKSIQIWRTLGFEKTMGSLEQGWIALENGQGGSVSLMKAQACPHLFFNPSLSYFNSGKNLAVIGKIRELQIPITEEITFFNKEGIVDNIIIRDPGGLGFFIFND